MRMQVRIWDIRTCCCTLTLREHTGRVFCVAITEDGAQALSSSGDKASLSHTTASVKKPWPGSVVSNLSDNSDVGHQEGVLCLCLKS